MLAYLGEYDKAFESLEQARSRPLCEQCDYCSCKDADLYEVIILLVAGRAQEALEKCRAGRQNWPRETDFVCWERMCLRAVQAE